MAKGAGASAKENKEDQSGDDDVLCLEHLQRKKQKSVRPNVEDSKGGVALDQI